MSMTKVGVIFSVLPSQVPLWPYKGYDYERRANELLRLLKDNLPEMEFVHALVQDIKAIDNVLSSIGDVDGYVVWLLSSNNAVPWAIVQKGKPTILIDDLYAGTGSFMYVYSKVIRGHYPVVGVASSKLNDAFNAIKLLKVLNRLKMSNIVMVKDFDVSLSTVSETINVQELGWSPKQIKETIEKLKKFFGVNVLIIDSEELRKEYESVDTGEAVLWRDRWMEKAKQIIEPNKEEILKSAKMYLAMKKLMKRYNANVITIDCISLFYVKRLPAYPCLGYMQLLDEGLIGTCEADLDSAFTQLVISYLTGRPGFISDPVIDQSADQIIYAHCVSPTKLLGKTGTIRAPYRIRSHAEDRAGASVQVLWPVGEIVTTVKFNILERKMSIHTGTIVGNVEDEKGCRTKVAVKTNVSTLLKNWNKFGNFGWHRVTVLGNWRRDFINLAKLMKFDIVEEDMPQ